MVHYNFKFETISNISHTQLILNKTEDDKENILSEARSSSENKFHLEEPFENIPMTKSIELINEQPKSPLPENIHGHNFDSYNSKFGISQINQTIKTGGEESGYIGDRKIFSS